MTPDAVFSAPGKALIAGGYLVLFPEFSALSVSLSPRIHAAAYARGNAGEGVEVESPQFASQWVYPSGEGTHPNPYIAACYETVSKYFNKPLNGRIVIWSDAGFHTQKDAVTGHFKGELSKFSFHDKPITQVPKTGLGSSAALVTSVTAAMVYLHTQNADLDSQKVHNLAQIAHCLAQKKIGSGFDVATAVFGPIVYSRFPASKVPSEISHESVKESVDSQWSMTHDQCFLPEHISVYMGDVAIGSETPGMVKRVLQWKDENPEAAEKVFNELNKANMTLVEAINGSDSELQTAIQKVRANLQNLTKLTNVPIEPQTQTALLDRATEIDGILGGVVPGAGGDDAICVLANTNAVPANKIESELHKISEVNWLPLTLEKVGLKSEDPHMYDY